MLSLLIDQDLILDEAPQPQTRQARREAKLDKAKKASKYKQLNQSSDGQKTVSKKKATKATQQKERRSSRPRKISFADHCHEVAGMIIQIAKDIDQLAEEKDEWFESYDHLVDALARQHQVVSKCRELFLTTSSYERKVITGALEICQLDNLIVIERKMGWLRLRVVNTCFFPRHKSARRLRAA